MQTKLFLPKKVVKGSQNQMQSEMLQGTRLNSSQISSQKKKKTQAKLFFSWLHWAKWEKYPT